MHLSRTTPTINSAPEFHQLLEMIKQKGYDSISLLMFKIIIEI